ncbi:MAG: IS1 family transposase [Gammaproteobacteria bacterium]|nr:IS1 family transposase [Gammaproteobacteria bacterium]
MNRLSIERQARIINLLCEGVSMRAITRLEGVGINTVARLIDAAGEAAAAYHDEHVRGIVGNRRIECDEVWAFVYAKAKNVRRAKSAPKNAGDAWTFSAIDADSKLAVSYLVGNRDGQTAIELMDDLRSRLEDRPQISTDGLSAYVEAIEGAFGGDVDFAQVIKEYGKDLDEERQHRYSPPVCTKIEKRRVEGDPDMKLANTSYVERSNLTMRMGNRRFTRLTNAFSKKLAKHAAMVNLFFLHYNFCRIHKTLRVTPAMEAGIETTVRDAKWIAELIAARAPKPNRPKKYRKKAAA